MMKVFVDTNVLLDLICQRQGFSDAADTLFEKGVEGKIQIVISVLTFINTNYTAHRYGYSWDELRMTLGKIAEYVEISEINSDTFHRALTSGMGDLEDAVQYFSALSSACDCIISRDKKGFLGAAMAVYSPAEFLNGAHCLFR